jgi:general nucleoside transport system permease protein
VLGGRITVVQRAAGTAHAAAYRTGALVLALAVGTGLAQAFVVQSGNVYDRIYQATFGTGYGSTTVLSYAVPLIFTALAFAVAYKIRLWNIGGEGQLFMGAWAASGIAFTFPGIPGPLLIALMILASAAGGALWILVPALARIYLGVTEVVTTLMLNFVAILWMTYFALNVWQPTPRDPLITSKAIPTRADLPTLTIGGVTFEAGLIIAVGIAVALAIVFRKTRFGYAVRLAGASHAAAEYAGIPIKLLQLRVLLLSGALAGMAGGIELVGNVHRLSDELSTNTGYNGIGVAVLAGSVLAVVPIMALVFGGLLAAGYALRLDGLSTNATLFLTGFVLLLAAIGESAARFRVLFIRARDVAVSTRAKPPGGFERVAEAEPS